MSLGCVLRPPSVPRSSKVYGPGVVCACGVSGDTVVRTAAPSAAIRSADQERDRAMVRPLVEMLSATVCPTHASRVPFATRGEVEKSRRFGWEWFTSGVSAYAHGKEDAPY